MWPGACYLNTRSTLSNTKLAAPGGPPSRLNPLENETAREILVRTASSGVRL